MNDACRDVRLRLFACQDVAYRDFLARLVPTVKPETVIGVRSPRVAALVKELDGTPTADSFLTSLPHEYLEENSLHAALLGRMRDYDACLARVERFLPYIDNWAVCDMSPPRAFGGHLPELYERIKVWLGSEHPYTVCFGINMLMRLYLGDAFASEQLERVAALRSEEYYVNMMIAWYMATALTARYDDALPALTGHQLERWTHNKAIQKAVESYRIPDERKAYLKTLRLKRQEAPHA